MSNIFLKEIVKRYPGVLALDHVSMEIKEGEIHALLGENGAGKSTLMKVLYGMTKADQGTIEINGERVEIKTPMDAIDLGIGMVHQHFMLADAMSVVENVIAGAEPTYKGVIDIHRAKNEVSVMIEKFGFSVSPDALIEDLNVGEKQQVEILKVLYRSANFLILDEPTAVLSPQEVDRFFEVLRRMKADGKSCVIITHKLYEVFQIADRVTVMRAGSVTGGVAPEDMRATSVAKLAEFMVGKSTNLSEGADHVIGSQVSLDVDNITYKKDKRVILNRVHFQIHKGEILGVAGVEGNGQSELVQALTGLLKPEIFKVKLDGLPLSGQTKDFIRQGIGHIPEDRLK